MADPFSRERAHALFAQGLSYREIADELGADRADVYYAIRYRSRRSDAWCPDVERREREQRIAANIWHLIDLKRAGFRARHGELEIRA